MLLYTYDTQRPIGTRARSLHVGTPYTWAHPPTCAPYKAVRFLTSARAPVVILQTPFLSFRYVLVATSRSTPRCRSGRFPQLRAMQGQKPVCADAHAPWLVHELAVYNAAVSTDS